QSRDAPARRWQGIDQCNHRGDRATDLCCRYGHCTYSGWLVQGHERQGKLVARLSCAMQSRQQIGSGICQQHLRLDRAARLLTDRQQSLQRRCCQWLLACGFQLDMHTLLTKVSFVLYARCCPVSWVKTAPLCPRLEDNLRGKGICCEGLGSY